MEKGAKIAAVLSFLAVSPAVADVVYVPCELPLARLAPVHFKTHLRHPLHRHHRHRHPVGKRGRVGLHFRTARGMCPIFIGDLPGALPEELGGPAGAEPFGGDWIPVEDASTDLGGYDFGSFGGFGGGAGGFFGEGRHHHHHRHDELPPPIFVVDSPPPVGPPLLPPPDCCGPTPPSAPVPEPSTWLLFATGMAAIGFSIFRQRLATVSRT